MPLFYYDCNFCLLLIIKLSNVPIYYDIDTGFSFYLIVFLEVHYLYLNISIDIEFSFYVLLSSSLLYNLLFNIAVFISYSSRVVKESGIIV